MAINSGVYPDTYYILQNDTTDPIKTSDSLGNLIRSGKLTPNAAWDGSNSYAGAVNNDGNYVGQYSTVTFDTDYAHFVESTKRSSGSHFNIRWFLSFSSNAAVIGNLYYRWTGLPPIIADAYLGNYGNNYTYYNPFSDQMQSTKIGTSIQTTPDQMYPVTSININNLIFVPYFTRSIVTYTRVADGIYKMTSEDILNSWGRLKPTDKTPQGDLYDDDLYNRGYKVEESEDKIVVTKIRGVELVGYYGSTPTSRVQVTYSRPNASSYQSSYPDGTPYATLFAMVETYNDDLGSVLYSGLPGVWYGNNGTVPGGLSIYHTLSSDYRKITTDYYNPITSYSGNPQYSGIIANNLDGSPGADIDSLIATNMYVFPQTNRSVSGNLDGFLSSDSANQYKLTDNRSNDYMYNTRLLQSNFGSSVSDCYSLKQLWSTIATLGVYISGTTSNSYKLGKDVDSNELYCGEMLSDGTTTGVMIQGDEIKDLPQTDMQDIINDTPYVPVDPIPQTPIQPDTDKDGRDSGTISPAGKVTVGATNGFVTYYALSASQVRSIGKSLWGNSNPTDVLRNFYLFDFSQQTNYELSYAEILDYFVSLKYFPFNIPSYADTQSTGEQGIRIGTGATLIDAGAVITTSIITNPIAVIDGGTCTVPSYYSSFMDSEPVAVASLYVPFCGTSDVMLSAITDKQLRLTYYVDLVTGCCIALVESTSQDGVYPVAELTGVMGFDMMLTGNNHNQQLSSIISSIRHTSVNSIGSITSGIAGGAASNNPAPMLSGLGAATAGVARTAIDMPQTAALHPMTSGTNSSLAALCSYHQAFVQIRRKNSITPANYSASVGYIANQTQRLNSISGYTQVVNPDLSGIPATADELAMIRDILTSGFYA